MEAGLSRGGNARGAETRRDSEDRSEQRDTTQQNYPQASIRTAMKYMVPLSHIEGLPTGGNSEQEQQSDSGQEQSQAPVSKSELEARVVDMLKSCYDPEIPVDIYELGLIYNVAIDDDSNVVITMTLTAPACPVAEILPGSVESRVASVPGVKSAKVELTFEPPWDKSMMSEAARFQLGFL